MSFYHVVSSTDRIVLTGHSLGRTQAQLVAAYLIHEDVISRDKLSVYSFGAPRFADHQFSKYFGQVLLRKKTLHSEIKRIIHVYLTSGNEWLILLGVHIRTTFQICNLKNSAISNAGFNREGGFNAFKYSSRCCLYIIERKATPMFHLFHIFGILWL